MSPHLSPPPAVTVRQVLSNAAKRQVTLTQVFTYPDSTSTAIVTLDRSGAATDTPTPPSGSAGTASSDGLGSQQIGILVGCLVGAFVLGILLWCCCARRCRSARSSAYEDRRRKSRYPPYDAAGVTKPEQTYWPYEFPQSIPPPVVPNYVAVDPNPRWTAYQETGRSDRYYYYGR
ncbi:hypothetical protein GGS23DRAFT_598866 [Durotheca rogersii]|uniref:uncharacterized protein n=1 Tax=Durotheca rogersii TaxID=419775 RepID=UPI00221E7E17|nr:uncharacterized protein GGS23DRAFT_598866 [Durotheca rogersii]KAI5860982.1 hypothetical protein GGS23DRAFT_598866 [Durotheca rogersii]